jgi:hypothetical protein
MIPIGKILMTVGTGFANKFCCQQLIDLQKSLLVM